MNIDLLVIGFGVFIIMLAVAFWRSLRKTCPYCHTAVFGDKDEYSGWSWCENCGGRIT